MGTKTETKSVSYCDVCNRQNNSLLYDCFVCEREFCSSCEASPREGTYFNHRNLCKECAEKPLVKEVQETFKALYWNMQKKEKEWFERLGKFARVKKSKVKNKAP